MPDPALVRSLPRGRTEPLPQVSKRVRRQRGAAGRIFLASIDAVVLPGTLLLVHFIAVRAGSPPPIGTPSASMLLGAALLIPLTAALSGLYRSASSRSWIRAESAGFEAFLWALGIAAAVLCFPTMREWAGEKGWGLLTMVGLTGIWFLGIRPPAAMPQTGMG